LEALQDFLRHMPSKAGLAFVVVTHQHPGYVSLLPEILSKATPMPVLEAVDNTKVAPNNVYVLPPGEILEIHEGVLHALKAESRELHFLPIDHFLRSLAEDQKENSGVVIFSGTGTDGTLGLRAVKAEGGFAIAQKPDSAKFGGMPDSAVGTGMADYVLAPAEMPDQLIAYVKGITSGVKPLAAPAIPKEPLQRILGLLRARTGHDFSSYKVNTILRRIERRMNIHHIQEAGQYAFYLQENPREIDNLFKELLISVTSFFRDAQAFDSLAEVVVPLVQMQPTDQPLRVWTPGSASGEETYSVAILLREAMDKQRKRLDLQLFGTDLDAKAVETARAGVYLDGITADVSPGILKKYFAFEHSTYRIKKEIRELAIFATQDVIKDPPFTKLDLIVCRNLLIYLEADLQKRLLAIFHYALKPGGFLFLGPSETIGNPSDLFESLDAKWKIFRRKDAPGASMHPLFGIPQDAERATDGEATFVKRASREKVPQISEQIGKFLLSRFAPTTLVVDDHGTIIYIHGRTGTYLEPAEGQPRNNILEMARAGLSRPLEMAMRQAGTENTEIVRDHVRMKTDSGFSQVRLTVSKINAPEALRGLLLVSLQPAENKAVPEVKFRPAGGEHHGSVQALEQELQYTKESLQSTIEELETSNEELKSTNEELQSANEEMQSTNEEMETSEEELQSLNEELTTVNAELQNKLQELSRTNDDMQNLLNGIQVATIFLDNQLNVKRFTAQARDVISLIPTDIGRPLADMASKLNYDHLVEDCSEVLRTLIPKEKEVGTQDHAWHLMRVMPYRTMENVIDGVVVTLVDITQRKRAEDALGRLSKVFMDASDPILIADLAGGIIDLNTEAEQTLGWPRADLISQSLKSVMPPDRQSQVDELVAHCRAGQKISNQESVCRSKAGLLHPVLITMSLLLDKGNQPLSISIVLKDLRAAENNARESG
jgi:two-component system CheB/CheR fusion protein